MNRHELKQQIKQSPAFVLDLDQVQANLQPLKRLSKASGCKVLYSMKALPLAALLSQSPLYGWHVNRHARFRQATSAPGGATQAFVQLPQWSLRLGEDLAKGIEYLRGVVEPLVLAERSRHLVLLRLSRSNQCLSVMKI
jgi:hypothetical protein